MTLGKKILLVVLLLPILVVLVSFFLPATYRVERSISIQAKPEAVFPLLSTLQLWPEWTAWTVARYPDMKTSFSGPASGVGAVYTWEGKTSGRGTIKITQADPPRSLTYLLDFEQGKFVAQGTITLQPLDGSVQVTWATQGDLGWNPVSRYYGLFLDKWMGRDLEISLRNLRQRVAPGEPSAP